MTLILDGISLFDEFTGKQVTGTYFYVKWLKDIEIRGAVDDERNFVFYEYDKAGSITGMFKGRFPETDPRGNYKSRLETDVLIGTWSRPDGTDGKPFYLDLYSITPREKGKGRYFDTGVEDDEAFLILSPNAAGGLRLRPTALLRRQWRAVGANLDFRNFAHGLDVRLISYDGVVLRNGLDHQDSALAGLPHDRGPGRGRERSQRDLLFNFDDMAVGVNQHVPCAASDL